MNSTLSFNSLTKRSCFFAELTCWSKESSSRSRMCGTWASLQQICQNVKLSNKVFECYHVIVYSFIAFRTGSSQFRGRTSSPITFYRYISPLSTTFLGIVRESHGPTVKARNMNQLATIKNIGNWCSPADASDQILSG